MVIKRQKAVELWGAYLVGFIKFFGKKLFCLNSLRIREMISLTGFCAAPALVFGDSVSCMDMVITSLYKYV